MIMNIFKMNIYLLIFFFYFNKKKIVIIIHIINYY